MLELWFEGETAVTPLGLEAITVEVAGDFGSRAFLIAVSLVRSSGREKWVKINLDAGTVEAIAAANGSGLTARVLTMVARNQIRGQY